MINRFCRENGFCDLRKQVDAKKTNHFEQQRNINYDELSYESFIKSEENDSLTSFPKRKPGFGDEPPKLIIKAMKKRALLDVLSNTKWSKSFGAVFRFVQITAGWSQLKQINQSKS